MDAFTLERVGGWGEDVVRFRVKYPGCGCGWRVVSTLRYVLRGGVWELDVEYMGGSWESIPERMRREWEDRGLRRLGEIAREEVKEDDEFFGS